MKRFDVTIDTDICDNPNCERCPNSESLYTDKDGLCTIITSVVDGLPLRCVGDWANDKIHYLLQYFQIFTQGMHNKWGKLRYVEICSGPGRCSTRDFFQRKEVVEAAKAGKNADLSSMFMQCYSDNLSTLGLRYQKWKKAHEMGIYTWVSMEPVIIPEEALAVIRKAHDCVDFWKVGKLNHNKEVERSVDWKKFLRDAVELLELYGCKYYIKEDLRRAG